MATSGSLGERILGFASRERVGIVVAVIVLGVAGLVGLLMGGVAFVGAVGVLIVVAASGWMVWRNRRTGSEGTGTGRVLATFGAVTVVVLLLIQLVPYGHAHANPPVTGEPAWATPATRDLMVDACFACHSNEVDWPWYSNIAPFSWVVTHHVDEGREAINYSEFDTNQRHADETVEAILEGKMPPSYYTALGRHPEGALSDAQIAELVDGLRLTPGMGEGEGNRQADGEGGDDHEEHDDDD